MQECYLIPAVHSVWSRQQEILIDDARNRGVGMKLSGNARCCSPGHTAKYGSYTMMDMETSKVMHQELVQVQPRLQSPMKTDNTNRLIDPVTTRSRGNYEKKLKKN